MKVGDLVRYRYFYIIALVVDTRTTRDSYYFQVFQLSGDRRGVYLTATDEDWEVISESR